MSYITPNSEQTASIVSGAQTASWFDLQGQQLVALIPDSDIKGTNLYFYATNKAGGASHFMFSGGAHYSAIVAAGAWNVVDFPLFEGIRFLQVSTSGTAQTAVAVITAVTRPIA